MVAAAPMLAVGPSSVAQLAAELAGQARSIGRAAAAPSSGPVLALVGSLSPVTRAQVENAIGFTQLTIDPTALLDGARHAQDLRRRAVALLAAGNVMLITAQPTGAPSYPRAVAEATGRLLRGIMEEAHVARLLVAGGDTSTLAIEALDIWGLSYRAPMVVGAPLCRAHSVLPGLDGLDIVLKGGQMGPPDFFAIASR